MPAGSVQGSLGGGYLQTNVVVAPSSQTATSDNEQVATGRSVSVHSLEEHTQRGTGEVVRQQVTPVRAGQAGIPVWALSTASWQRHCGTVGKS